MKYFKKRLALSGVGLLLGAAVVATGVSIALLIANFVFGVAAVNLLGVTGIASLLLGPIGLGVVLGVGALVCLASSIHVHRNKKLVENWNLLGAQLFEAKTKSYNFSLDAALGIISGLVFAGVIGAIGAFSSLALLSGVGLGFAFVGAALCLLIPAVKLLTEAFIVRASAQAALGLDLDLDVFSSKPPRGSLLDKNHSDKDFVFQRWGRQPRFFASSEESAPSERSDGRFASRPAQVRR